MPDNNPTTSIYDRLSRWYDLIAGPSERAFARRGLAMLGVQPGELVLGIGSGTGAALSELARRVGTGGTACGIDASLGMCRIAQKR